DHTAREGPIAAADTIDYETTQTSVSHGRRTPPRVTDEEAHTSGRGRAASRPAMHLAVYTFQNLCLDSRHPRPPRRSGTPPIDGGRRHRPKEVTDAHAPHPGHRLAAAADPHHARGLRPEHGRELGLGPGDRPLRVVGQPH